VLIRLYSQVLPTEAVPPVMMEMKTPEKILAPPLRLEPSRVARHRRRRRRSHHLRSVPSLAPPLYALSATRSGRRVQPKLRSRAREGMYK